MHRYYSIRICLTQVFLIAASSAATSQISGSELCISSKLSSLRSHLSRGDHCTRFEMRVVRKKAQELDAKLMSDWMLSSMPCAIEHTAL